VLKQPKGRAPGQGQDAPKSAALAKKPLTFNIYCIGLLTIEVGFNFLPNMFVCVERWIKSAGRAKDSL
jgi:hypothetical protein